MNLDRETTRNVREREMKKRRICDIIISIVTQHISSVKRSSVPFLQSLRQIHAEFHVIVF